MTLWNEKRRILITCARGTPGILAGEAHALHFPVLSTQETALETEGTLADTVRLNLTLRTAQRILYLLDTFAAGQAQDLHRRLRELPWETIIAADGYLSVTSSVKTDAVNDTRFANVKTKDAIVDRIRDRTGRRPDSGPGRHGAVVHLHWEDERCEVWLDTSGEPLSRRGYRKIPLEAPMQETLAAAVILATGWDGGTPLVNPMCGSGTLAIEGALAALGRAPGILRQNFGFMHILGFDRPAFDRERDALKRAARRKVAGRIVATDIRPGAVEAARQNARTAGVEHLIEFAVCDFRETPVPGGEGIVILNPEYGERMGDAAKLGEIYREIGNFFKNRYLGYRGYIFTGNLELAKTVGLRTKRRIPFYNGPIECRLLEYELYRGSRKAGSGG
ncbi:MAG: Ribosomal RNA large subunit methyltransferase L [Syntrophaceae bacterium PtaB.Bin038]|nr:MAG: Ribosomal RNA large subunit methyltransferase L [Syntrophaceae bacterium PtaB.Bin038]